MSEVILEQPAEGIAVVKLNRPEVRNALNAAVRQQLADHFTTLGADETTRCIVITGGEKVFAAGADLRDMVDLTPVEMIARHSERLWQPIASCPKPVIAAVNGYAFGGGCELAMLADIIIAGEGARFGQPEVRVGIMPGAGGTQRLTRAIGKYRAMRMLLTGEPVSAREALAMALVSEVVADADVFATAMKVATTIASLPPLAIMQIKESVLAGQDVSLETAIALERKAFQLLFSTSDQKEGMRAFLEKRKPEFRGQ